MKQGLLILFACLMLATQAPLAAQEIATTTAVAPEGLKPLLDFAGLVVAGNRNLLVAGHELETARFAQHRSLEAFSPQLTFNSDATKDANSSYNSLTGLEEDYSTRRRGSGAAIAQRTPLGQLGYAYSSSRTEYSNSQSSYFRSLYLSLQSGLLRNDARVNALDRRLARAEYEISEAQADSVLLDVLFTAYQSLFSRIVAERNQGIKRQNLNFYATLVEEAEIKLKTGIGSELDRKQASMRLQQAETGNAETGLSLQENDRRLAAQLGDIAWNHEIASFSLEPVVQCIPASFSRETLEEKAFSRRPDYRVFLSQYKAQKAAYEKARQLSRPDLSARARWGRQGRGASESEAADMQDKSWDVSLVYSMSLGHDGEKLDFAAQREKLKAFAARLAQKRDDIRLAVADALERLEFHHRNLTLLQASMQLSTEVLEGQQLNFQLGKISLLDLTRYQQEYDNASLALVQGETQLILEWLRLHYETGTLAEFAGVAPVGGIVARIEPVTKPVAGPAAEPSPEPAEMETH